MSSHFLDGNFWQLYLEDLCEQGTEHGINLQLLEATEQGTETAQTKIPSDVLQSTIQELGEFRWTDFWVSLKYNMYIDTCIINFWCLLFLTVPHGTYLRRNQYQCQDRKAHKLFKREWWNLRQHKGKLVNQSILLKNIYLIQWTLSLYHFH